MSKKIDGGQILHRVLKEHPETAAVFESYRMGCRSCGGGAYETVSWGAMVHGVDLAEFVARLNEAAARN